MGKFCFRSLFFPDSLAESTRAEISLEMTTYSQDLSANAPTELVKYCHVTRVQYI